MGEGAEARGDREQGEEAEGKVSRKKRGGGEGAEEGESAEEEAGEGEGRLTLQMRFTKRGSYYTLQTGTRSISFTGYCLCTSYVDIFHYINYHLHFTLYFIDCITYYLHMIDYEKNKRM